MDSRKKYRKTLIACYLGFVTQAICSNFAPLLFLTFHRSYGIGFDKLALISAVFFLTQLLVDLVCAKAADRLGYRACITASEILSGLGLAGLAVVPELCASPFAGILLCVVLYAAGLGFPPVPVICVLAVRKKYGKTKESKKNNRGRHPSGVCPKAYSCFSSSFSSEGSPSMRRRSSASCRFTSSLFSGIGGRQRFSQK